MDIPKTFDADGRLIFNGDRYIPVNPTNKYGDVLWAKIYEPKPPRRHRDSNGNVLDVAWVLVGRCNGDGCTTRLVLKRSDEEVYRLNDRPLAFT
jgi:hypothetical protein